MLNELQAKCSNNIPLFAKFKIPMVQTRYPNHLTWPLSERKIRETRGMFREALEAESHACLYQNTSLDLDQSGNLPVSALVRTCAALLPESLLLQDYFSTYLSPSASWTERLGCML